jgi:TPR repeat protein
MLRGRDHEWLKREADEGYEHAILRLGDYYLKGRGVK